MDLVQHSLSNLEIETHDPHSSSSQKEEVIIRNWVELHPDVMAIIFMKLGHVDILTTAQWVCSSWWKLSKQPHLYRCIHVEKVLTLFGTRIYYSSPGLSENMAIEAVDRSCGQLVKFSVTSIATDKLLHYMSQRSSSLRSLRLLYCDKTSEDGLIEMAKKLPQLEELEVIHSSHFSKDVIETFGRSCPLLKSCQLNYVDFLCDGKFKGVPAAIARNMPELRYLNLLGNVRLTGDGLKSVLDGCPHLKSLDLRHCYLVKFARDLKERYGNLEVVRHPYDR